MLNIFEMTGKTNSSDIFSKTVRMPVLFLGHGNPMNAIEENQFSEGFRNIALTLPKPDAILCISAHWFTRGTKISFSKNPPTIHDFYGFPKKLYEFQYPAKGCPELAEKVRILTNPDVVEPDNIRGLDHGAWSVITHLYPNADVPVVQLSIDNSKPADYHYNLSKQLKSLRDEGILIIGSGNIIHNLSLVDFQNLNQDDYGYDWAIIAKEMINSWIINEDYKSLIDYDKQIKAIHLAIPTPDHYLPLIYALGLKEKQDVFTFFNDKLVAGSLSMTSLKIASV